jgi:hypothetical protein
VNFSSVQGQYATLKRRLVVHSDAGALADITVDVPRGENDELSFLRLVAWAYVAINETGKVPLGFLKELPPLSNYGPLMPHVHALRTWMSHNLSFTKERDLGTLKLATSWFISTCGKGTPSTLQDWEKCFKELCCELSALFANAVDACDAFSSDTDGPLLIDELKKRIDRKWDAYRFDPYVQDAATRLGYSGLDAVSFRQRHLDQWRQVVAAAEDQSIDRLLTLTVEASLLKFMGNALPLTSQEILKQINCDNPTTLAAVMLVLQQQLPDVDLLSLIEAAFQQLNSGE